MRDEKKTNFRLLRKILASAPPDYWLALNCGESEIIAWGADLLAVLGEAKAQGFTHPLLVLSPRARRFPAQAQQLAA